MLLRLRGQKAWTVLSSLPSPARGFQGLRAPDPGRKGREGASGPATDTAAAESAPGLCPRGPRRAPTLRRGRRAGEDSRPERGPCSPSRRRAGEVEASGLPPSALRSRAPRGGRRRNPESATTQDCRAPPQRWRRTAETEGAADLRDCSSCPAAARKKENLEPHLYLHSRPIAARGAGRGSE